MVKVAVFKENLGQEYFFPSQIAEGIPCATEVAIHSLNALIKTLHANGSKDKVALVGDAINAFNLMDRATILDNVKKVAKSSAKFALGH